MYDIYQQSALGVKKCKVNNKWINYSEQINYCLIGMMKIADCMKIHNIVIPPPN